MNKTVMMLLSSILLAPCSLSSGVKAAKANDKYGIETIAKRFRVDKHLVYAIIKTESNWNASAIGDSGRSNGLMQVQCATARALRPLANCLDLLNPRINVYYGVKYLRSQINLHGKSNIWLAVAAYNSGRPIFRDGKLINSEYVDKVMKNYYLYKNNRAPSYI
jgi:soluble lytic murein transglycosylase